MRAPLEAEVVSRRFGLLGRDGQGVEHLLAQLDHASAAELHGAGLMSTEAAAALAAEKSVKTRARRERLDAQKSKTRSTGPAKVTIPPLGVPSIGQTLSAELGARVRQAHETRAPFLERLTLFWLNVFSVSAQKADVGNYAGALEREAIRPHLLGRFSDMLIAVATHPAMLIYLDNDDSFGPRSPLGRRRKKGLNENFARELLELHTLGVDGGYAQDDVTNLAKVLTGWSLSRLGGASAPGSWATFDGTRHEPGDKTLLGRTVREGGPEECIAVLDALASHPSTARNIARRLAGHFIGETPAPDLERALAESFRRTGGDLRDLYAILVRHEAVWMTPLRKMRPPLEHVLVIARNLGWAPDSVRLQSQLMSLGQPYFRVPSPEGWPEGDDSWASPNGLKRRLDFAELVAADLAGVIEPKEAADRLLGEWISPELASAIRRAGSAEMGMALLLMSPEVLRR